MVAIKKNHFDGGKNLTSAGSSGPKDEDLASALRAAADDFAEQRAAVIPIAGHVNLVAPIAAELISIVADVLLADGAQIIAAQPDYPRTLQVRITDADSSITAGTLTIVGVSASGEAITEAVDLTGGTATKETSNAFAHVTSATVAGLAGNAAGDNVGVGVGPGIGLPIPSNGTNAQVNKTIMDEADEAVGATFDDTYMVVTPTTAPNAVHDYHFWYSYTAVACNWAAGVISALDAVATTKG